ncbi:unnamed protein product [Gongylonema pulchrum]|uniref:CTNNB1_binding domain-containing protein n=1 Tax=Gongylonema pulchrum TaxID=637853 RepID=A0A183E6L6_9BILA|nr:unnamed protein product [Gongylonema pulchrum]
MRKGDTELKKQRMSMVMDPFYPSEPSQSPHSSASTVSPGLDESYNDAGGELTAGTPTTSVGALCTVLVIKLVVVVMILDQLGSDVVEIHRGNTTKQK